MKIVSSGRVLNSQKFYQKKKRKRYLQFVLLSFGLLLCLSLVVYLSRQERFLIAEVIVLGENIADKAEIARAAERALAGDYLWLIPRANAFIYPRRAVERHLTDSLPILKSVRLALHDLHTLTITVEEHTPFALYCASTASPAYSSEFYFIDEEGLIFAPAPAFSWAVYFVYATAEPIENPLGKRFVTIKTFQSLSSFIKTLAVLDIHPLALEVGDDEYSLLLPNGGEFLWHRGSDLALVYANLAAFLSHDSIKAQSNFFDRLLRLDLRTENKVFYKFKN